MKTSTIKTLPLAILMSVGAGAAATVLYGPLANADEPTRPEAGSESARATLNDIAATGSNPTVYVTIDCPR